MGPLVLAFLVGAGVAHADPAADRASTAAAVLMQVRAAHAAGRAEVEAVYRWSVRLRDAELAMGRSAAVPDHLGRMRALLASTQELANHGLTDAVEVDAARFYVLEAEGGSGSPPAPTPPQQPAAPAQTPGGGAIEACFQACDVDWKQCTTEADHLRLGVGTVSPEPECLRQAELACGVGRSQTAVDCRDGELRDCTAGRKSAVCSKQQGQCTARCR